MKKIVKYAVINIDQCEAYVIMQDGGVATCHNNQEHMISEYYQDRLTKDMFGTERFQDEGIWGELGEGKMYCKDWKDKQEVDEEIIQDLIHWLYMETDKVEFVREELDFKNDEAVKNFIIEE